MAPFPGKDFAASVAPPKLIDIRRLGACGYVLDSSLAPCPVECPEVGSGLVDVWFRLAWHGCLAACGLVSSNAVASCRCRIAGLRCQACLPWLMRSTLKRHFLSAIQSTCIIIHHDVDLVSCSHVITLPRLRVHCIRTHLRRL